MFAVAGGILLAVAVIVVIAALLTDT